jgi:hypothetical protein
MKTLKTITILSIIAIIAACSSGPKVKTAELENKGTSVGVSTPDWVKTYVGQGISKVQAQYENKYCVIGEESSANKQFALAWADNFSAQQRIGAMLRTGIQSRLEAKVDAQSQSKGSSNSALSSGTAEYRQQIDNVLNSVVNVSYSGAQRDSDWWILTRRYDPDQEDLYTDEYTAYVLYTVPKTELNRQIASALETSVSKDSILYDATIELANEILLKGVDYLDPKAQ